MQLRNSNSLTPIFIRLNTLVAGSYSKALSTSHFNAVGLYDEYGSETGYLLSPLMALVNHSCLPNCCQVVENGRVFLKALRYVEEERSDELMKHTIIIMIY